MGIAQVGPAPASDEFLTWLSGLVCEIRPDWDWGLVRVVLVSHRRAVSAGDLAVAVLRGAQDPRVPSPKALMWRGPHWDGLATRPESAQPRRRCGVCGKTEDRCHLDRPGPDDHPFEPVERSS